MRSSPLFRLVGCLSFLCLLLVGQLLVVQKVRSEQSAWASVQASTERLLARLVEVQPLYKEEPERFYAAIQVALDPYIDFVSFSQGVMARHHAGATAAQREAFLQRFRDGLIRTYATALLEFDNQKVEVVRPDKPQKKPDRATILLRIHSSSGKIYPVYYNLALKEGRWLLRNVVIDGINLGLQFRSQFNAYMQKYKGDLDAVIENWDVAADDEAG